MNRMFLLAGSLAFLAFSSLSFAGTCALSGPGWTFQTLGSCGSDSSGVSFTQNGQTITIFPEWVINGQVESNSGSPNPVNGLFEVQKGQNGNLASGIGPYDINQGGSPYQSQLGIQDYDQHHYNGSVTTYDEMLFVEVANNGSNPIADGTTLKFLMQEGDVADTFNVYTLVNNNSAAPPNLFTMTENYSNLGVGPMNGGATTPQFSITTATNSTNHVEWIGIEADCQYLLLNQITETSAVPEPRFYGLLLAALLGLVGVYFRNRKTALQN